MDYDALALSGVLVSAAALFISGNLFWMTTLLACSIYGGWRIGYRVINPDATGV